MKTYLSDLIPRIQRFSQKLDDLTMLTNHHWVSIGDINESKCVYIFRANNQLLISENGIVSRGIWEYLDNQSILIDTKSHCYLLKHGFFDGNILALKLDSTNSYAFFVNESKCQKELNSIEDVLIFLEDKYLKNIPIPKNFGSNAETIPDEENEKINYEILSETREYNFFWGTFFKYEIKFSNGSIDLVYRGNISDEFFFLDGGNEKVYCKNLDDAICQLYRYKIGNRL